MTTDLPWVARVALEGTFNAERWVNVLHFAGTTTDPLDAADLTAIIGILDDAATDADAWRHIWQTMDTGAVVDTITATTLSLASPVQVSTTVSLAGASSGTDAPPMLSAVLKWGTDIASRRYRGRTFLTGLNTGFIDSANADRVNTVAAGDLATRATAFAAAWAANPTYSFVILSETDRQADAITPVREVISASVNPLICVQRRRRERPL